MKREYFINKALAAGLDSTTAEMAADDYQKEYGAFEDTPVTVEPENGKAPSLYDAMYPRLTKAVETGKGNKVLATGLDIASLPFRAGSAAVGLTAEGLGTAYGNLKTKGAPQQLTSETFTESLARTGGDRRGAGGIENTGEEMARDPANVLLFGTGPLKATSALSKLPMLGKAAPIIGKAAPIVTETAGSVAMHQAEHTAEGDPLNLKEAAIETGFGLGIPVLTNIGGKAINRFTGRTASQLSGVSEDALRAYRSGKGSAQAIQAASGTQKQIGEQLLNVIDDWDNFIPEINTVKQALPEMGEINVGNVVEALKNAKVKGPLKIATSVNDQVDVLIADIESVYYRTGTLNMSAEDFYYMRRNLDSIVGSSWGKDVSTVFINAVKKARHEAGQELIRSAQRTGNQQYVDAMKSMHEKMNIIDDLKSEIGKDARTRAKRVQGFIDNMFGKNKEWRQNVVTKLDKVFGSNVMDKSKLARTAAELGPEGVPTILPRQTTGRSKLGISLGGLGGGGLGALSRYTDRPELIPLAISAAAAPALLSSPSFSSNVALPISTMLEKTGNKMTKMSISPAAMRQIIRERTKRIGEEE